MTTNKRKPVAGIIARVTVAEGGRVMRSAFRRAIKLIQRRDPLEEYYKEHISPLIRRGYELGIPDKDVIRLLSKALMNASNWQALPALFSSYMNDYLSRRN